MLSQLQGNLRTIEQVQRLLNILNMLRRRWQVSLDERVAVQLLH